jgi:hypothetical protein
LRILDLFKNRVRDEVLGTKVLVAVLNPKFAESASADCRCYTQFYPNSIQVVFEGTENLLEAIRKGYDIVHLFADVTLGGNISDNEGHEIPATQLLQCCSESDVKLLWLASPNKPEGYIKGFKAAGTRLNLVMTLDRKNSRFASFLENLLRKMSAGQSMPLAWVSLSPQNPNDPRNQDAPACIFAAGRGGVRLC